MMINIFETLSNSKEQLREAEELINKGSYDNAAKKLRMIISAISNVLGNVRPSGEWHHLVTQSWLHLGYTHFLQSASMKAEHYFSKALALDPNLAIAYYRRGVARYCLYTATQPASLSHTTVLGDLEKAWQLEPENVKFQMRFKEFKDVYAGRLPPPNIMLEEIPPGLCIKLLYLLDCEDQDRQEYQEAAAETSQAFLSSLINQNISPVIDLLKQRLNNEHYLPTFFAACKHLEINGLNMLFSEGNSTKIDNVSKGMLTCCDSWTTDKVKRFLGELSKDDSISHHVKQIISLPQETHFKELLFFYLVKILEGPKQVNKLITFAIS